MLNDFEKVYKILKRIEKENIFDYNLNLLFNEEELILIKLLYEQKYITNIPNKETGISSVVLTNAGKSSIFAVEHKEDIIEFKGLLECMDCDIAFIFDFLRTRDFNKGEDKILSFLDYLDFLEEKEEIYKPKRKRKNMSN